MLRRLILKNFQSHKLSKLTFSEGVNVIVGATDSGKSAIIRALRYITRNKPDGTEFIREGKETCRVVLRTDENSVTRQRSKSNNVYKLNEHTLTAFGREVPEEIQSVLNIQELNFQEQMDSPFLLKDTPGSVASHFNTIAHLDKIDLALSNVNSKIRKLNTDEKYCTEQIQQKREQLEELPDLETFEKELIELETLEKDYNKLKLTVQQLTQICVDHVKIKWDEEKYVKIIKPEKEIDEILQSIYIKLEKHEDIILLRNDIKQLENLKDIISHKEKDFKAEKPLNEILLLYEEQRKSNVSLTKLQNLIQSIEKTKRYVKKGEKYIKEIEKEYHKLMPNICPLCNQKIKK